MVDRNNRGALTEQDLRTAFANKESSLIDAQIITADDILLPLYTRAKNANNIPRLWTKFSHGGRMNVDDLCDLIRW